LLHCEGLDGISDLIPVALKPVKDEVKDEEGDRRVGREPELLVHAGFAPLEVQCDVFLCSPSSHHDGRSDIKGQIYRIS